MPKLPRDVSHDRMVRFLRKRGWTLLWEGAHHTILRLGAVDLAVPRHALLKTGTVAAILAEAGVGPKNWAGL
jgi:hypothetical protein